jgi:hypothetical protein
LLADPHHVDAGPDADLDPAFHFDADPDADPHPTVHSDADPDADLDPTFRIRLFNLIWMRIRIQFPTMIRIHADPDPDADPNPQHWEKLLEPS